MFVFSLAIIKLIKSLESILLSTLKESSRYSISQNVNQFFFNHLSKGNSCCRPHVDLRVLLLVFCPRPSPLICRVQSINIWRVEAQEVGRTHYARGWFANSITSAFSACQRRLNHYNEVSGPKRIGHETFIILPDNLLSDASLASRIHCCDLLGRNCWYVDESLIRWWSW